MQYMKGTNRQSSVYDALHDLCERGQTGCLEVRKVPFAGTIYLQGGYVIDVDLQGRKNQEALQELLSWADGMVCWYPGSAPYRHTCHIPLFELEALWASIKPTSGADPHVTPTSRAAMKTKDCGALLPNLAAYSIVLQAQDPAQRPSQYELGQPLKPAYLIGASHDCDIRIDHYSVSQMHAALIIENDLIRLWDLGSHNATHVNGDLVDDTILQSGDTLQIGDIAFKVTLRAGDVTPSRTTIAKPKRRRSHTGPVSFEKIVAEKRRAESDNNPLFKLFDTLRSGKPRKG